MFRKMSAGYHDAWKREAKKLSDARIKKALKKVQPGVEYLYTEAVLKTEIRQLTSCGWEVHSTAPDLIGPRGQVIFNRTTLRIKNPTLTSSTEVA